MKNLVIGILAHVDAGKTTLSEGLLYSAGAIDRIGRVDKRDSFFDTYTLERERGITIFSKQATMTVGDTSVTLIDTPGHIDFSCEAERALSVQDYAILVINACDGIQSHTKTLWHLLASRKIPTFIFVNKTDIAERNRIDVMRDIRKWLSPAAADFSTESATLEDSAGADETLMAEYFDTGAISDDSLRAAIAERRLFPCFFGSALKMVGVKDFLYALDRLTRQRRYSEKLFGATVYKISRDKVGRRLTYMKITGGTLAAKDVLRIKTRGGDVYSEKVEEIRLYSADKYKSVKEARPGTVCAVLGLEHTEAGMGIGAERGDDTVLSPVLDYKIILPSEVSEYEAYLKLVTLTEEDPSLALTYNERTREIRVRLMGEIQLEVLRRLILERFGIEVSFGEGAILYKETVRGEVIGRGHFEPLRHYAEVHLRIEELPEGSGIITDTDCSTDVLALNWQRLIVTHIEEKAHRGVLTGSPLTDVKITLCAGRAHQKHTEGGDFRQATYRAIRQGLMKAESVLLEPTFDFRIELPTDCLGRAMTDVDEMGGISDSPEIFESTAALTGNCPVATMRSYATKLRAYTKGEGRITIQIGPYKPCHNADEVIAERAYDPTLDERNTPNSVFCKNGSGYVVKWDEADELMDLDSSEKSEEAVLEASAYRPTKVSYNGTAAEDKELMRIFEATYGKIKPRKVSEKKENSAPEKKARPQKPKPSGDTHVIIDGYNFIFAWDFLRSYAELDLALARDILTRIVSNYSAFKRIKTTVVFDAYKRQDGEGSIESVGDTSVVYTKEHETADSYIEKLTATLAKDNTVRVVSSDLEEQRMILGSGGLRVSAREFSAELESLEDEIKEIIEAIR